MNIHRIRLVLAVSIAAIVLGGIKPANAATIEVGEGEGRDFDTIQAGIDAASDGDTVLVAPGEYIITEPITFRGKAITVRSEAGRDETTIRMGTPADPRRASVMVFENNETVESVLDGFTITGGSGILDPSEGNTGGGGIVFDVSAGTVKNCAIVQNTADYGGGVICWDNSSMTMTDCIIRGNSATELNSNGGGVFCGMNSSITMTDCAITDNTATESGGGLLGYIDSSITMTDCIIRGNSATKHYGGGVCCDLGSSLTMTDCTIAENSAGKSSGGVACWKNSPMTLTNCTIVENSAPRDGGLGSAVNSPTIVINCTIWGNSADIRGGGLSCYDGASATVTNSIFWGNTAAMGIGDEIYLEQAPTEFSITYSNVAGGQAGVYVQGGSTLNWGAGNIDADPLLVDPANGDCHLKSQAGRWDIESQTWVLDDVSSPCIDAGDPNSSVAFEPYPNGCIINMGAYGGTAEASKSPTGFHAKYGGGTGEPNDPYLIYTAEHLNALGAEPNDYDKHFKLMADIDLSGYTYDRAVIAPDLDDDKDWLQGTAFTGVFDGNGHTISHLTIEGGGFLGLFGQIGLFPWRRLESEATVSNLGLEALDVSGMGDHVGGLVGFNYDGSITNSYSTGKVSGDSRVGGLVGYHRNDGIITASYSTTMVTGVSRVGGLVGFNHAPLTHCYSTGTVCGDWGVGGLVGENSDSSITDCYSMGTVNGTQFVGGLVGYSTGSITTSFSTGTVVGRDNRTGGLVGGNLGIISMSYSTGIVDGNDQVGSLVGENNGSITTSYGTGPVTGSSCIGGLVGWNMNACISNEKDTGIITNSYSCGTVTGNEHVGGLVGRNEGTIVASYSTGMVTGDYRVGGLIGHNMRFPCDPVVTDCLWDTQTSGLSVSADGTGKTTAAMQTTSTFLEAGWDFVDEVENGIDNIWCINEGQDYPRLWWEVITEN